MLQCLEKDFEKFIKNAHEHLPDSLYLQSDITDKNNKICFARLKLSGTSVIERAILKEVNLTGKDGFYIDIFPLDNFLKDEPNFIDHFLLKIFKAEVRLKAFKGGKRHSSSNLKPLLDIL